jgi:2-polyprenyl-6-hydroxyphenyl methylase/3-demethylubiquinone-9 3-methyltransferase
MSNVDIDEVNKFAALASRWWDKNSEFKPLMGQAHVLAFLGR